MWRVFPSCITDNLFCYYKLPIFLAFLDLDLLGGEFLDLDLLGGEFLDLDLLGGDATLDVLVLFSLG